MTRYLPHMTSKQVEEALQTGITRVIFPLGANEQHGPHGPLGTDSIAAMELSLRVAESLDALVAPVLPVGYSPQHLAWKGSLSLTQDTLQTVVVELGRQLVEQGFAQLYFISGHGGNRTALEFAARELAQELGAEAEIIVINLLALQTSAELRQRVEEKYGKALSDIWEAHGGEQEAAMVLAHDDSLVDLENAPNEPVRVDEYLAKNRNPEAFVIDYDLKKHSKYGSWGDPRGATAEQGRIILDTLADYIVEKLPEVNNDQ